MNDIMISNYLVVGTCLIAATIGLVIFIKKALKPSWTYNDVKCDAMNNDLHELLQKEKAHFAK
ncbi:hypothetical protein H7198_06085 [Fructobacillus sp. CRL 2054]|uniref:hypothetical protein n=1 Tax=Fructobacillus sp. CRL 2054 TaxID=2763007 RepID=UPI0023793A24|nr:hypothetical protein [Fructobacillus sp. CRL 2054]MDD9139170.1 hypothetical protein [Fructobacillus sp. CRL 2054]